MSAWAFSVNTLGCYVHTTGLLRKKKRRVHAAGSAERGPAVAARPTSARHNNDGDNRPWWRLRPLLKQRARVFLLLPYRPEQTRSFVLGGVSLSCGMRSIRAGEGRRLCGHEAELLPLLCQWCNAEPLPPPLIQWLIITSNFIKGCDVEFIFTNNFNQSTDLKTGSRTWMDYYGIIIIIQLWIELILCVYNTHNLNLTWTK